MISPVIIKGNKLGIRLIIAPEATMDEILLTLESKLQNTSHYYKSIKPITVTFDGKLLTEDEIDIILDALREIGLNITTRNPIKETKHNPQNITSNDGLFFIGNIRNGQSLNAAESIVIIGDIEAGGAVYSEGNIIIIGRLDGYAESGYKGRNDTFVYSLISGEE